tara:strand:+ start:42 stop:290 length:249 start_codon:yes stop_codon:yes gene_type:complete
MKITKRQLRRIIKEEKRSLLKEMGIPGNVGAQMGTDFVLESMPDYEEVARGNLLNPADLKALAAAIEAAAASPDLEFILNID